MRPYAVLALAVVMALASLWYGITHHFSVAGYLVIVAVVVVVTVLLLFIVGDDLTSTGRTVFGVGTAAILVCYILGLGILAQPSPEETKATSESFTDQIIYSHCIAFDLPVPVGVSAKEQDGRCVVSVDQNRYSITAVLTVNGRDALGSITPGGNGAVTTLSFPVDHSLYLFLYDPHQNAQQLPAWVKKSPQFTSQRHS